MKNCNPRLLLLSLVPGLLALSGCSRDTSTPTVSTSTTSSAAPSVDGSKYLLNEEPEGAKDVIKVREEAQDKDDVLIVGRIGGSANPWSDGRAAFLIVDGSLHACSDIEGDDCPKPWDYCCEADKLPSATVLVKLVDDSGELIRADARELLKIKELQTVVIKGKASRDEDGNLTVLASGVYVKKSPELRDQS